MSTKYILLLSALFLSACATPKLHITSSSPAIIENRGVVVCDTTPCTIKADYETYDFTSICKYTREMRLEAFPIDKDKGTTQFKLVEVPCDKTTNIHFDMESAKGIKDSSHGK